MRPELDPTPPRLIRIFACWLVLDGLLLVAVSLCPFDSLIRPFFFACFLGSTLAQIQLLGGYYMLIQEHCRYALLLLPSVTTLLSLGVYIANCNFSGATWSFDEFLGFLSVLVWLLFLTCSIGNLVALVLGTLPFVILTWTDYILWRSPPQADISPLPIRFSIRSILLLTFLVALMCCGWRMVSELNEEELSVVYTVEFVGYLILCLLHVVAFHRARLDWWSMLVILLHMFMIGVTVTIGDEEYCLVVTKMQIAHALIMLGTCLETRRQGYRLIRNASKWDYRREWDAPPSIFVPKDSTNSQQL